jgi:hypothetical protein
MFLGFDSWLTVVTLRRAVAAGSASFFSRPRQLPAVSLGACQDMQDSIDG